MAAKQRVLVTGSTGFVGRELLIALHEHGYNVLAAYRNVISSLPSYVSPIQFDLTQGIDESKLKGVDTVIHTAARVHVMNEQTKDPLTAFRQSNTEATLKLAKSAVNTGVKRFIFLSSIKVNGEATKHGQRFSAADICLPTDPYGFSKYEAEQSLLELAKQTGMEVVIIRPPLVYGPGVKANFLKMMRLIDRGVPLPFGKIDNKRSLVALDNLVSFIIHCIDHPKAANEIFLISDGEDVSTTELLTKLAKSFDKKPRLIPVPVALMRFAAKVVGKNEIAERLFGSLQVDSSKARELLAWKPVTTMDEQLNKTAEAYLNETSI